MSSRRIGPDRPETVRPQHLRAADQLDTKPPLAAEHEFALLLGRAGYQQQRTQSAGLLQEAIRAFVIPAVSNPAILRGDRRLSILERLVSDILPQLDDADGARSLSVKVVRDEIARQRELFERLQQGLAA